MKKRLAMLVPLLLSTAVWFPLLFLAGGSLMGEGELLGNLAPVLGRGAGAASWSLLPRYPTLRPYVELLLDSPAFFATFWNSTRLAFGILLGQLLIAAPAAWGFARGKFPGKNALFTLYIVLMLMPFQVTMAPSYYVLGRLSLLDTHAAVLLPAVFSTFPVFIIHRFFRSIPAAVLESAELDGAGPLRSFWSIGLPLGSAGVLSAMVLGFLEYWNLVEQPLTFLRTQSLWPLSLYLPGIIDSRPGLALAASAVTLAPALFVFLLGQDWLEQGIVAAAIKE